MQPAQRPCTCGHLPRLQICRYRLRWAQLCYDYLMTRFNLSAFAFCATLFTAAAASADVGPPPQCPAGQHDEYNMGHHCVPDAAPLEAGSGSAAGSDTGSATGSGASAGSDVAKPAPVVSKRGCGCQSTDGSTGALAFVGTLFVGLAITRRARKR